ncbi:glycosyltransferase family 2 protein [Bradyrhizobium lablabi]|nr:glycosyltransferase family 2 protein [Bradyrhizobium lablabi]
MTNELTLSVVIPNHNYANYVGAAVRSALDIRWPNVEVIVVDDGSTDNSLDVIKTYADRITLISQANAGQMPSCVNGFHRCKGDVVIFLDSDDALHPDVMTEIAAVWSDTASKFQFQMRVIDATGNPTGSILPQYFAIPTPREIHTWVTTTGVYPTPPGSGSAYPRSVVDRIFGFESDFVDRAPDSYLIAAAPVYGDVITIPKPLVDYRVHGLNHGAHLNLDDSRFAREVDLTRRRHKFFTDVASSAGMPVDADALNRNLLFLCLRAASYSLRPDIHPIAGDSAVQIVCATFKALAFPQGFSKAQRTSLLLWMICALFGPRGLRRPVVSWRYVPTARPQWMKRMLSILRVVKRAPA